MWTTGSMKWLIGVLNLLTLKYGSCWLLVCLGVFGLHPSRESPLFGGTILVVPITFWGLCWGPAIYGNCHLHTSEDYPLETLQTQPARLPHSMRAAAGASASLALPRRLPWRHRNSKKSRSQERPPEEGALNPNPSTLKP